MISLVRQSSARVFNGVVQNQTLPMSRVAASVYDKRFMAALSLEPGKYNYYHNQVPQGVTVPLEFPVDWNPLRPLYVAIWTTGPLLVHKDSGTFAVMATDSDSLGQHYGLWSVQEAAIISLDIEVPSTVNGGYDCEVKVFMYEIPDLTKASSYVDNVVALGTNG